MNFTKAFILTADWQDIKGKNILHFFAVTNEDKPIEIFINNYKPVFFINREISSEIFDVPVLRKEVNFLSFDNKPVDAVYFNTQQDLLKSDEKLHSLKIKTYEADIDPVKRYLMEKGINVQVQIAGKSEKKNNKEIFFNPVLTPSEFTPDLTIASIDIETGTGNNLLYSVAVHLTGRKADVKKVFMLGEQEKNTHNYIQFFKTETELIYSFNKWFSEADPDVIIGWHVIGFDLLYLEEKSRELSIPLNLSRGKNRGIIRRRKTGGFFARIPGRVVIDGPQALRTSFFSFEDYKLESVAREMLGVGKKITPDKNKVAEIEKLFSEDKTALAEYNLQDAVLVTEIFKKSKLIELFVKRAQISGLLMEQLGMMSAAFDHFYLPKLHSAGYVAPNVRDLKTTSHAAGGYVMDPKPGLYNDVIVLDFKSLYPSIIHTFKIDPLSRLLADTDTITTPTNFRFSASKNFLPDFINQLMKRRAEANEQKDKPLSQAIKILMNSFYGVMGSYGCRFYHPDLPSAITGTGQWLLLNSKQHLEEQGYEVLYGDTDSLFVKLKDEEGVAAEKTGKIIAENLNNYWLKRLKQEYNVNSVLEIEFEKHYKKFILTPVRSGGETGAKKRYAGFMTINGKEVLEFVGMEFVRSDWTKLAKEFQEELYKRVFTEQEIYNWIKSFVAEISKGAFDDKIIYRKRLRKNPEEYIKNVPPQVRAAKMLESSRSNIVYYIMTKKGPVPVELNPKDIDYQHYIEKQIKPIADSVLVLFGESFNSINNSIQLNIFDD